VEDKATGAVLASFNQDVPQLQPDTITEMNVVWDDSGVPFGEYQVVGYMAFPGGTSVSADGHPVTNQVVSKMTGALGHKIVSLQMQF
jgi:hypothetical protein